jgi:hypothetical protein
MRSSVRSIYVIALTAVAAIAVTGGNAAAQSVGDPNSAPNPYRVVENWLKLPEGSRWSPTSVRIDRDGASVWVFDRCGQNSCAGSTVAPINKIDAAGNVVTSFGAGLFVFPHGFYVDREGNVWASDAEGKDGKGHQVIKFSPDGKVLLTLGKAGVAGQGPDTFNRPSDVAVAANGDIFVADGHGGESNARVVKFAKDGTFIKAWGKKGSGQSEFNVTHAIAVDSQGRVYVGDRENARIQVFDGEGKFLAEWKQFGRPTGLFIDHNDILYVTDQQSDDKRNPGFKKGVRIGSVRDGKVTAFILAAERGADVVRGVATAPEGVAADRQGNFFAADLDSKQVLKYVKN